MLNDDDTKFTDQNNQRTYSSYKAYKMNSIKLLIYNSSDKKKLEALKNIKLISGGIFTKISFLTAREFKIGASATFLYLKY